MMDNIEYLNDYKRSAGLTILASNGISTGLSTAMGKHEFHKVYIYNLIPKLFAHPLRLSAIPFSTFL